MGARLVIALRTVPWLTLKRLASSTSLGIISPGFHSPDCRLWVIKPLICWYRGEKVGDGAPVAPWASAVVWLGVTGFIARYSTTSACRRPEKSYNLYVLYKT